MLPQTHGRTKAKYFNTSSIQGYLLWQLTSQPIERDKEKMGRETEKMIIEKKKLTLISELGWSMKTISDSSPSNKTLTVFSPNSSSEEA